jgi:polyisoprenoid-binding protein YceI
MRARSFLVAHAVAVAVIAAPAPTAAARAPGWSVVKPGSQIEFAASMNGQGFKGVFRKWDARIAFDPRNLTGSSVVALIDTGSAVTGDASRDESLPTEDWFSTKAFPRASFTANRFKDLGQGRYQALGELNIRGVKRPVTLPFQLVINGDTARMRGSLTIDRRLFGVGQGQWATGEAVATAVQVNIAITAQRAK